MYYKYLYIVKYNNINNDLITLCYFYDNEIIKNFQHYILLSIDNYDSFLFYVKNNLEQYRRKYFCMDEKGCEFNDLIHDYSDKFGFGTMVVEKTCWEKLKEIEDYHKTHYVIGQSQIEKILKNNNRCCMIFG